MVVDRFLPMLGDAFDAQSLKVTIMCTPCGGTQSSDLEVLEARGHFFPSAEF